MSILDFTELEIEESIPARFEKVVDKHANKTAIVDGHISMTYRDLDDASSQVAQAILAQQQSSLIPVILFLPHGVESIVAILGILKTGRAYVALNQSLPAENQLDIIEDTETDCILTNKRLMASMPDLAKCGRNFLTLEDIELAYPSQRPDIHVEPKAFAAIFYTSGTTGKPKGVVWSHRAVLHGARNNIKRLSITSTDKHSLLFSRSAAGSVLNMFSVLLCGATLCPFSIHEGNIEKLTRWLVVQKITIVYAPTTFFKQWLDAFVAKEKLPHLKMIMVIGQVLHKREVAAFKDLFNKNTILVNRLGLSESGGLTCYFIDHKVDISSDIVPVGYAIDDKDIFLTDDSGQEISPGMIGEIRVRSRYLSSGYWRNPQLTEQKFLSDPSGSDKRVLLTGDLGCFSDDGCLEYIGRKDNMVKIRGFRVETEAIDAALSSLVVVKDAVVIAQENSVGEKKLVAYLVPQTYPTPTISELRRLLADILPEYMIPSFFVTMDALPLNQNGKVARSELPPPDFGRPKLEEPYTAPRNKTESQLVEIWQKVLGVRPIGVKDNFNDLGGESLLAIQLVLEVELFYKQGFQAKKLSSFSTVEEMAGMIDSVAPTDLDHRPKGDKKSCGHVSFLRKYRQVADVAAGMKKMICTTVQDYIQPNSKGQSRRRSLLSSVDYLRMLAVITMRQNGPIKPGSLMTGMNTAGVRKPFFWCSNGYAATESLGKLVHPEQPIYGLYNGSGTLFPRPKLLDQQEREQLSDLFKILATHYVNELLDVEPNGPYLLGGNCVGGKLAVDIAMQLQERGKDVERLCLIETFDERLFDFQGAMQLLYGDQSHLHAYRPFRWGESGWEKSFRSVPLVEWLPGPHGQFLSEPTIHVTAEKINMFLQPSEEEDYQISRR